MKTQVITGFKGSNHFTRVIAVGRLLYGLLLLLLGMAIFNLIGKNLTNEFLEFIHKWHISAHIYYVHWLLQKIPRISTGLLVLLSLANFFYAALAFGEAIGLAVGKRWAYWLVIWDTASFIPIETYQLVKEFGWVNFTLLLYYLITVIYLLWQLKKVPSPKKQRIVTQLC